MTEAVNRLLESQELWSADYRRFGKAAGRTWAKKEADVIELRRLEQFSHNFRSHDWSWDKHDSDAFALALAIFVAIDGWDSDRSNCEEFWEKVLGNECPDGAELEGFVEGALAIWQEAKQQAKGKL